MRANEIKTWEEKSKQEDIIYIAQIGMNMIFNSMKWRKYLYW